MNHPTTPIRRLGLAVTGIVALAAGGVVVLGATGSASALADAGAHTPILTGEPGDPSPPPDLSLDDLMPSDDGSIVPTPLPLGDDSEYQGPIVTIPLVPGDDDDDGPIYQGPITSIPLVPGDDDDDDGPIYQGPLVSIPLPPQDDTPADDPPDTTLPPTELPDTPATTTPTAPDSAPTDAAAAPYRARSGGPVRPGDGGERRVRRVGPHHLRDRRRTGTRAAGRPRRDDQPGEQSGGRDVPTPDRT